MADLNDKLVAIEEKLGGTEPMPVGTQDALGWHLDYIESLIDGGGSGETTWSPYTLDYTFDEIYTALENQDEESLSLIKEKIIELVDVEIYGETNYIEFSTKDGHIFKLALVFGVSSARTFDGNKEILVQITYEIDVETGDYRLYIPFMEAREVLS